MAEIQIKEAGVTDLPIVQQIGKATFYETFAASNTEANMNAYLERSFSEAKLTTELSNPNSLFFIAYDDVEPIGYLKVNTGTVQTEPQDENALEIERIYVKSSHHGKKVGQLLYEKVLAVAQQRHHSYIWLGVWENNLRALRFYEKNGFVAFDKHVFKMGNDQQVDVMMKKELF